MDNLTDKDFVSILQESFGEDTAKKVIEALGSDPAVSVRYNPSKPVEIKETDTVAWSPYGRFLESRPVFTLDPLFHAGCYYVQDSSAMFVGHIARQTFHLFENLGRPVRVLDLCAAPGGKTTDLAASLRQTFGGSFILVANEVMRQRSGVLADNVSLWGDPNVLVCSVDPRAFAGLGPFFDIIVADVPCSGEGMFRKDQLAVQQWSLDTVALCEARQRRIIADVWPSLCEGGVMVYSTCTFNVRENDGNVRWIAENLDAEPMSFDIKTETSDGVIPTELGFSLVPGMVRGEGQYCAALRKTSGKPASQIKSGKPAKGSKIQVPQAESLLGIPVTLSMKGDLVIAIPENISAEASALSVLKPLRTGVAVGTLKGKTLVPDSDIALCSAISEDAFPKVDVDRATALSYLHRDTIVLPGAPTGFVLVCYQGHPLGFVKNLGNRCNNLHPQDRRIRMDIDKK